MSGMTYRFNDRLEDAPLFLEVLTLKDITFGGIVEFLIP